MMFQDIDAKLKCANPGMDWVSGCPGPLLAIFGYRYVIDLVIDKINHLVKSGNVKDCFSRTVSAFQCLCRDRFWQQSSVVRSAYSRPFGSTSKPLGSPWIHIRRLLKQCMWGYDTIPQVAARSNNTFQLHYQVTLSLYVVHHIASHDLRSIFHHMTSHVKVSAWTF